METGWLARAGAHKIEHVTWGYVNDLPSIDLSHPPLGLLHTTQGPTIEGALSVFRQHFAPTFTVGVDARKRGRIIQHVPLGKLAAALENKAGGVETNRECRVQIEIVGFAQTTLWLPGNPTLTLLAALLGELESAAGIPLKHPAVNRSPSRWANASGWVGHIDAPENAHWDPGKLNYARLFQLANAQLEFGDPAKVKAKPRKHLPVVSKAAALKRAAKTTPAHPLCNGTVAVAKPKAAPKKTAKKAAPKRRRYYTRRRNVKLAKGQTVGYVKGKGYYAKPVPKKR